MKHSNTTTTKVLYIGDAAYNSMSLNNALLRQGVEICHVNPHALVPPEKRLPYLLRRIVMDNALSLFDKQPEDDPIMRNRGIRCLRRDRGWSEEKISTINKKIRAVAAEFEPDLTIMFHFHVVNAETVNLCRHYGPVFCYFPDDAFAPEIYTLRAAEVTRLLDCVMTTKSFNVPEFKSLGIPRVVFANNSYDRDFHAPAKLTEEEISHYSCDVSFLGSNFVRERADLLAKLVEVCPDVEFGIWGSRWNELIWFHHIINPHRYLRYRRLHRFSKGFVPYTELSKVHSASKINLCLLKPSNGPMRLGDVQTTRTVEIPASGGFMLAEYTDEHAVMFAEGCEAVYFRSFDDLVEKIHYYLEHDDERRRIAEAGLRRAQSSGYTFDDRAQTLLQEYRKWYRQHDKSSSA